MAKSRPITFKYGNQARFIGQLLNAHWKILGSYTLKLDSGPALPRHETTSGQENWQSRPFQAFNPVAGTTNNIPSRAAMFNLPAKAKHKKNAGGRGFTLLELLLAIAIIGILSAIAIPAYNGYIDKTKINTAISDIRYIQVCIERYYTETFRYPPTITDIASCLPNNGIDPWGNPYVYLNIINGGPGIQGQVRKDHATHPINTLYDLYSIGKDGQTQIQLSNDLGKDDIVLGRDGGFVGLGQDF